MLEVTINVWIITLIFSSNCINVLVTSQNISKENGGCEDPWEQLHNSCVQFVEVRTPWEEARNSCLSMNSDLLVINNEQEDTAANQLINRYKNASSNLHIWWIGIRIVNGSWQWVDNEQKYAGLPKWAPNSLMSYVPENITLDRDWKWCGILNYQGYLLEKKCTQKRPYICQQSATKPTQSSTSPLSTTTIQTTHSIISHTGSPNTRPFISKSTETPGDISTDRSETGRPSTNTTNHTTDRPSESTTADPITDSPTDSLTRKSTDKETTKHLTENPTETSTDKTLTGSSSDKTTEKSTDKGTTEYLTENPTITSTDKTVTGSSDKTTEKSTDKGTTAHLIDSSTETYTERTRLTENPATGRPTDIQEATSEHPKEDKDEFVGCFAVNYESTCPPVEAFGIAWPRSEAGKMVNVSCNKGHAKWYCDKNPTCWRDEPDVKQCTSENIQELTTQMEEFLSNTSNSEKAVEFTENLAASVVSDNEMSEQDIFQSTKLMDAASQAEPKNSSEAKNIIKNVAKCGSGLVEKKETWATMNVESRRTVASSLLNSMESVTNKMLESFEEPTVETITEENMAIELHVIDVNEEESETNDTVFQAESNSFAIPVENLKRFSTGGMARLVFINYETVGEYLVPADYVADDNLERQMISQVISASMNEITVGEPLNKPVVFTMKTENVVNSQEQKQLCSFWNFSLGYTGAWSQEGCSLIEYNDTHVTCQCDHLTNFAILMDIHSTKIEPIHAIVLSYVTYAGIIISIICLFFSWITFVCLSIRCIRGSWSTNGNSKGNEYNGTSGSYTGSTAGSRSTQGQRNSIHKNLAFCLFIAEVLFLAGIERTDNKVACAIIAGFLHYFFLSSFTWMFVEGIHIVFMLVQVFDAARSRLKYYYMIGYGAPLLIVGISALVYYEGYGTEKYCWLASDRMFIWSFAGPVIFILLVNLIVLIYAMSAVFKHSEYVFTKDKSRTGNIKAWIQGALAMEVLLGLTWIFGYFYISEEAIPVAYLFTIFNSLQGLFIFVFHCLLNKKVRKAYTRFIDYPGKNVSSGTHSTKATHRGSDPSTPSYHMNGTRKHSKFLDLQKDRRPSSMSTTSA